GTCHRDTILKALGIAPEKEYSTFEYLGNIGTVSLPLTAALAEEREFLRPGDRVGLLGIGSGLNCLMLGVEWESLACCFAAWPSRTALMQVTEPGQRPGLCEYPFTGHHFTTRGLQLHYLDEGAGDPVVMVHGNPTWSYYYRNLVLALRDTHRCIVP